MYTIIIITALFTKAQTLLEDEKKATPNVKFRVIKCTETYDAGSWV